MGRPAKPWWRAERGGWFVTIRGKKVSLNVNDPGPGGQAQAEDNFRKMVGEAVASALAAVPRSPDEAVVMAGTVRELVPRYLAYREGRVKAGTHRNIRYTMEWMAGKFGPAAVASLSGAEVERAAGREGWTDGTRMIYLSRVQAFVRWCGRERFRMDIPAAESRGAEAVLSDDEFARLVAAADGDFRAFLLFLRHTGCRPGEARVLTADGVDWSAGVVELKQHKTRRKGKKRVLYLSPAAVAVLDGQRQKYGTGPLFRNTLGRQFGVNTVQARMQKARKKAGVRASAITYGLRHTYATRLLESGAADADVAALLGHAGTGMLYKHYAHLGANARRLRDVATKHAPPDAG